MTIAKNRVYYGFLNTLSACGRVNMRKRVWGEIDVGVGLLQQSFDEIKEDEGIVRGRFFNHHHKDFEPTDTPNNQYAPYLLEILLKAGLLVSMALTDSEQSL